jgi:putative SOS response-associated peptidase YedK
MCGRFTLRTSLNILLTQFHAELRDDVNLVPRYNVAPTQDIPIVRQTDAGREISLAHWGLIPSWATDPKIGYKLINARSDTAPEKPSYQSAFKSRRCLIPADGFFEWQKIGTKKQPIYFRLADGGPFAFAGLWERWKEITSCTLLTTEPNELVANYHDRMPVILSPNDYAHWLDTSAPEPQKLLTSFPASEMVCYPVNPIVSNSRNEGEQCIEPLGGN